MPDAHTMLSTMSTETSTLPYFIKTKYHIYLGKPYKGKVCFTKHLWEHSIYWETFDGVKNQERVLSIQAAIILSNPFLEFLLVTSPSSQEKKKEDIKASENSKQHSKKKRKRPYVHCIQD